MEFGKVIYLLMFILFLPRQIAGGVDIKSSLTRRDEQGSENG